MPTPMPHVPRTPDSRPQTLATPPVPQMAMMLDADNKKEGEQRSGPKQSPTGGALSSGKRVYGRMY